MKIPISFYYDLGADQKNRIVGNRCPVEWGVLNEYYEYFALCRLSGGLSGQAQTSMPSYRD